MTEQLALKYRPRGFDDLVGQPAVQVILRQMVALGRVPTALLFDGSRGTGKTTTARILAAALNCEQPADPLTDPCGSCVSCKATFDGSSLDVIEIDAASNGLVEDIRTLREQVMYRVGGRYRVVILDEAHSMSTAAFNALLKTLEEPPPATVFILLTTTPSKIIETVASRCMPFTFRRLGVGDIAARLGHIAAEEHTTADPTLLHVIAERADGAMRDAIMLFDLVTRVGLRSAADVRDLLGAPDIGPTVLAHLVRGNLAGAYATLDEQINRTGEITAITASLTHALRDILILRSGGDLPHTGDTLTLRRRLADAIEAGTALAALKILWDLKTKVRASSGHGEARADLELATALLADVLRPTVPTVPTQPIAPARISLGQMQNLVRP
jgi:DNA polymerase-3 subunit gamma/tau